MSPNTRSRKLGLRTTLVFPFVLQVVVVVGLVGWLSFRSGQRAVNVLASQLCEEIVSRVQDEVKTYLDRPYVLHQINARIFQQNLVNLRNQEALIRYFEEQSQLFDDLGTIAFANDRGEFVGANGQEQYIAIANPQDRILRRYRLNGGQREFIEGRGNYDPRRRFWYKTAVAVEKPTWTPIEAAATGQQLNVSMVYPLYKSDRLQRGEANRTLQGVLLCDVPLSGISTFLQSLKIGQTGQAFILERDGLFVADSAKENPLIPGTEVNPQRLPATQSRNPLLRTAVQTLNARFGNLSKIEQPQQLQFSMQGKRQFLQVQPLKDGRGINWLILVVVPESDFMGDINANTRHTFILCAIALLATLWLGIMTSRWITRPIVELTKASDAVASGQLNQYIQTSSFLQIREIEMLANSFNSMAAQLKASFNTLEAQKDSFARFFPSEFLKFLHKSDVTEVVLGDNVSKEMAIAFSDIRSFTTISESLTPQENFDFVNTYLHWVSPEIRNHNGFVVKYIGDAVMAVFPDSVDDALRCGIAEFRQLQQFNRLREEQGQLPIQVGMGIHVGYMMVGMLGDRYRVQGDAISDNVNLTARLEGLTKYYGVSMVISEEVLKQLDHPEDYQFRFLDRAIVKGRSEAIAIYEVLDVEAENIRTLKLQTLPDFQQGLDQYRRGEFARATVSFQQVLTVNPADKTAKLYLERIQQLHEIPEDWNGVWAFTQK